MALGWYSVEACCPSTSWHGIE